MPTDVRHRRARGQVHNRPAELWKRDGIDRAYTSRQVVDWRLAALLDPDDDTDTVLAPVLMAPATKAGSRTRRHLHEHRQVPHISRS